MRCKLLMCFLLFAVWIKAAEKEVTPETFASVYPTAEDGDVFLMSGGTYSTNINVTGGKSLTFKGNEEGVIFTGKVTIESNNESGALLLENIEFDYKSDYLLNIDGNYDNISLVNCHISNLNRCLAICNDKKVLKSLNIENSIISVAPTGYSLIYGNSGYFQNVTIINTTMYNYPQEHIIWMRNYDDTPVFNIELKNNTFYKLSKGSYFICNIAGNSHADSHYTFTNNLFIKSYSDNKLKVLNVNNKNGNLSANNNLIVDYDTPHYNIDGEINDFTMDDLGLSELPFPNPDAGNFSIPFSSVLASAGVDGVCLGDPRWIVSDYENPAQVNVGKNMDEAGNVNPEKATFEVGTGISVQASANFGYRFLEWQDTAGETISSENPYSFHIEEDTELIAIFEKTQSFIVGWSFTTSDPRNNRSGDFYDSEDNKGLMKLFVSENGTETTSWGGYPDGRSLGGVSYPCIRRYTDYDKIKEDPRYFEVSFSARGFDNISLSCIMGSDNEYTHKRQLIQYSTDGNEYKDLIALEIVANKWYEIKVALPTLTDEEKDNLRIRWKNDISSGVISEPLTSSNSEGFCLANVIISGDKVSDNSYTREMYTDGGLETICFPFDVTEITDGKGKRVSPTQLLEYSANSGERVYFSEANSIEAHKPYLIALPEDNTIEKNLFTFNGTTAASVDPVVTKGNYSFIGTYSLYEETSAPNYYVLNKTGDSFVKAVESTYVPAYRAYFKAINSASHSALKIDIDGTTNLALIENKADDTIIYSIENGIKFISDKVSEINVYSIDGCLVRKVQVIPGENTIDGLAKGIYIVKNKKVVIK